MKTNPTPVFAPSMTPGGNKRPRTFDVFVDIVEPRQDLQAALLLAIGAIVEPLEPDQKLWIVKFAIRKTHQDTLAETIVIDIPGREFLDLVNDSTIETAAALKQVINKEDDKRVAFEWGQREAKAREIWTQTQNSPIMPAPMANPDTAAGITLKVDGLDGMRAAFERLGKTVQEALQDMGTFGMSTVQIATSFEALNKALKQNQKKPTTPKP